MHNVERSAFRKGEFVGYGNGVWRIRRAGSGGWVGHSDAGDCQWAPTLKAMSDLITKV